MQGNFAWVKKLYIIAYTKDGTGITVYKTSNHDKYLDMLKYLNKKCISHCKTKALIQED